MISILAIALFVQLVAANPIYRHQDNGTTTITQVKETPTATSTIHSKLLANATSRTEPITLAVPTSTTAIPIVFSSIITSVALSPTEGTDDGSYWSSLPGAEATASATADLITTDPTSTYTPMDDTRVIADPTFTDSATEIPAPTSTLVVRDVTGAATRTLSDTELPTATGTETETDVPTATESATGADIATSTDTANITGVMPTATETAIPADITSVSETDTLIDTFTDSVTDTFTDIATFVEPTTTNDQIVTVTSAHSRI
ncbi:hypothetical protein RSOLAG22IIIB_09636 [Rhizoctonia solani]|uniref:Uncharacterized protein n=1 Tax=Rhizoctonia solani TaxID=456999 RepID=A0A0K6FZ06_9AGAM|nr:hypothetical protein RSOLAG22IIIB_09636 [Rhizoctonia solani]